MLGNLLGTLVLVWWAMSQAVAFADCNISEDGMVITVTPRSCERIDGDSHPEVRAHVGPLYKDWNLKEAYTGALLRDSDGYRWMYPSKTSDPCREFPIGKPVQKRLYQTCCDTGRWGKCVFGGSFLGDLNGPKLNAFQ